MDWKEAPGSWELSPAQVMISSHSYNLPIPTQPHTAPFPYNGQNVPDQVSLFLFCLPAHIPFCL